MEVVTEEKNTRFTHYLLHHAVFKELSTTTKIRCIFDGSNKSSTNKSLNDILMVGPVIQRDLFSILLNFQQHQYVLTSDIAKIY